MREQYYDYFHLCKSHTLHEADWANIMQLVSTQTGSFLIQRPLVPDRSNWKFNPIAGAQNIPKLDECRHSLGFLYIQ